MTLDEFMTALEKTPRRWKLGKRGEIRQRGQSFVTIGPREDCPWTILLCPPMDLNFDIPTQIFKAADNEKGHDPELRARLLRACGLEAR